jgi:hypothetical protein
MLRGIYTIYDGSHVFLSNDSFVMILNIFFPIEQSVLSIHFPLCVYNSPHFRDMIAVCPYLLFLMTMTRLWATISNWLIIYSRPWFSWIHFNNLYISNLIFASAFFFYIIFIFIGELCISISNVDHFGYIDIKPRRNIYISIDLFFRLYSARGHHRAARGGTYNNIYKGTTPFCCALCNLIQSSSSSSFKLLYTWLAVLCALSNTYVDISTSSIYSARMSTVV